MSHSIHDTPTETDKQADLERQLFEFDKERHVNPDFDGTIFCPWCFKGNRPGMAACCPMFTEGVEKRGKNQFDSVMRQMKEIRLGSQRNLVCPYCRTRLLKPESGNPADWQRPNVSPFCCDLLHNAVTAIAERGMLEERIETMKRVQDNVSKQ